jgi:hypothetical protein
MRLIFFVALIGLAACTQSTKKENSGNRNSADSTLMLPPIDIITTGGDSVRISALKGPLVLILFTPDCDHCQREAADISNHFKLFEDYTLYFVAAQGGEVLQEFAVKYHLANKSNVVFAQGPIVPVIKIFKPTSMPTILIYNEDGVLAKRFDGETKVEDIEKFL